MSKRKKEKKYTRACVCVWVCLFVAAFVCVPVKKETSRLASSDPGTTLSAIKKCCLYVCLCVSVCLPACVSCCCGCLLLPLLSVPIARMSLCCWISLPLLRFVWENSGRGNYMWNFDGAHEQANSSRNSACSTSKTSNRKEQNDARHIYICMYYACMYVCEGRQHRRSIYINMYICSYACMNASESVFECVCVLALATDLHGFVERREAGWMGGL